MNQHLPVTPLRPEDADLSAASIVKFLKLCQSYDLVIRVQATIAFTEPTFYLSKSKTHNIGDVKDPSKEVECVFITATNLHNFGVKATWYDGKFSHAIIGGQRSGHRPEKMFTLLTKMTEEIKRCMS